MKFKVGDIITARVSGIQPYGAFVTIDENNVGLIHISEISDKFVRNVGDYVQVDDEIFARVIEVDDENKRYKLTIKNYDYREGKNNDIVDVNGFTPLAEALPEWMKEYREKEES